VLLVDNFVISKIDDDKRSSTKYTLLLPGNDAEILSHQPTEYLLN
jgi:hypothetical protein